jgi:tetratricopeptide (TPR) repeat protein
MLEPDNDIRYRHMVYARVYENFDYVDEALNSLFEALQIQSSSTDWREDQSLYQGYIEDKIALLYYYRKHDILKALEFGSRALQYNPNDEHLKMNYILYFKEFAVENGGEVNE